MTGEITDYQGELFYVVRVPMETDIEAPGPSGEVARVGDRISSLDVDGVPLNPAEFPLVLATAEITQIDFVVVEPDDFVRSDCNTDGELDIADPLQLLFHLYVGGTRSTCLKACDSNGSGRPGDGRVRPEVRSETSPAAPSWLRLRRRGEAH